MFGPARRTWVLGGGGARGAAQVGVLQALFEAGVEAPAAIVGTSVGALNGASIAAFPSLAGAMMLDRMGHELETLRKLLKSREEKLTSAGVSLESHADVLDRQFWAAVPDSGKRTVLMSAEAWCVPPRNVQQYVEELLGRGENGLGVGLHFDLGHGFDRDRYALLGVEVLLRGHVK